MTGRIRVLLLLALVVLGTLSLVAQPTHEIYWQYFTDDTYSELCGEKWNLCGWIDGYGCRTSYVIVHQGDPC